MIVWFGFEGPALSVETPDRETGRAVAGLFPGYLREDAGAGGPPPALTVRRRGRGYRIEAEAELLGRPEPVTAADRPELLARVEVALTRGMLGLRPEWPHLHAAGAVTGGGGVLALGPAGAGKSSLALAWSAAGHPLLGDDVVLLDPGGRARPFRRLLKVDPERLREHGMDPGRTPHWAEGWDRAWFDPAEEGGGWWRGPVRPRIVTFVRREAGAGLRAEGMDAAEALHLLLAGLLDTGASRAASVDPLRRLLEGARTVRLRYGESARAAAFLADLAGDRTGGVGRSGSPPGPADGAGPETTRPSSPASGEAR